jgi:hypothetical protein
LEQQFAGIVGAPQARYAAQRAVRKPRSWMCGHTPQTWYLGPCARRPLLTGQRRLATVENMAALRWRVRAWEIVLEPPAVW